MNKTIVFSSFALAVITSANAFAGFGGMGNVETESSSGDGLLGALLFFGLIFAGLYLYSKNKKD